MVIVQYLHIAHGVNVQHTVCMSFTSNNCHIIILIFEQLEYQCVCVMHGKF